MNRWGQDFLTRESGAERERNTPGRGRRVSHAARGRKSLLDREMSQGGNEGIQEKNGDKKS